MIYLLLWIQYFLIISSNFFIQGRINVKLFGLSAISGVIFTIVYSYFGLFSTGLLWVYLSSFSLFLSKREIHLSLISSSTSLLMFIFSDYLTLFIDPILHTHISDYHRFFWTVLLFLLLVFGINGIFAVAKSKTKIYFFPIISIITTGTFFIHFIVITVERYATSDYHMQLVNRNFLILYCILSVLVAGALIVTSKRHYQTVENRYYLSYLEKYAAEIESKYDELRAFKHDYQNILITLESYIQQGDMAELSDYFRNNIKGTSKNIFQDSNEFSQLSNISVLSIKSIFLSKLSSVDTMRNKVSIIVFDKIDSLTVDATDLIRALGIILDNAIEAMDDHYLNNFIECAIFQDNNTTRFIITNSFHEQTMPLHLLKRKGFSTKGADRGLGLSNLDSLIARNSRISLETAVRDNTFCQILTIV